MPVDPAIAPYTSPVAVPPDNIAPPALALHEPPGVTSLSTSVRPKQIVGDPNIGAGTGLIVNTAVVWQPVGEGSM